MKYKAEVRVIPEHIIYYKEYFIKDYYDFFHIPNGVNVLQDLSDKVMAENPDIELTDPDYNVIVYLDGEYKAENVRVEFCDSVTGFGKDTDEYRFRKVEAFTAVNVMHRGPYHKLEAAYSFAYQWMKDNGYRVCGCPRDSAINGCWNRDSDEDYLTEIQVPVEKIK